MNINVKILRLARELIASGAQEYICYALTKSALTSADDEAVKHLKCVIWFRLWPGVSLEDWLWRVHRIDVKRANQSHREKIRITRLAWIDSLIEEFSR